MPLLNHHGDTTLNLSPHIVSRGDRCHDVALSFTGDAAGVSYYVGFNALPLRHLFQEYIGASLAGQNNGVNLGQPLSPAAAGHPDFVGGQNLHLFHVLVPFHTLLDQSPHQETPVVGGHFLGKVVPFLHHTHRLALFGEVVCSLAADLISADDEHVITRQT